MDLDIWRGPWHWIPWMWRDDCTEPFTKYTFSEWMLHQPLGPSYFSLWLRIQVYLSAQDSLAYVTGKDDLQLDLWIVPMGVVSYQTLLPQFKPRNLASEYWKHFHLHFRQDELSNKNNIIFPEYSLISKKFLKHFPLTKSGKFAYQNK